MLTILVGAVGGLSITATIALALWFSWRPRPYSNKWFASFIAAAALSLIMLTTSCVLATIAGNEQQYFLHLYVREGAEYILTHQDEYSTTEINDTATDWNKRLKRARRWTHNSIIGYLFPDEVNNLDPIDLTFYKK